MTTHIRTDLLTLAMAHPDPGVSFYLPAIKGGKESKQHMIRYKRMLREAAKQLSDQNVHEDTRKSILMQCEELLVNSSFWRAQKKSIAIFVSENTFQSYLLPFNTKEQLVVSTSFYIAPLLRLLPHSQPFFILVLSLEKIRLLHCGEEQCEEVQLADLPHSLSKEFPRISLESNLQSHGGGARSRAIFHGHGAQKDQQKKDIDRFLRDIDTVVCRYLMPRKLPLILAGITDHVAQYKNLSAYPFIFPHHLSINPDTFTHQLLYKKSHVLLNKYGPLENPVIAQHHQTILDRDLSAHAINDIIEGATQGRIQTLILDESELDQQTNLACIEVLRHDGDVYIDTLKKHKDAGVTAIFRY